MKQIIRKLLVLPCFFVFVLFMIFSNDNATGQTEMDSPWWMDRWDPGRTERNLWAPGMMGQGQQHRMARHWTFMNAGVPSAYRGQRNPMSQAPEIIRAGGELYQKQCEACHGVQGLGNGVIANSLNPSPALLAYMIQMPMSVDEYLLWSISEGGKEFGTGMPGFKESLSEKQIWEIITYMRAGFPANTQSNQ